MDLQTVSSRDRISFQSDQGYGSRPGIGISQPASILCSQSSQQPKEDILFRDVDTNPVSISHHFTIRDPLFLRYEIERRFVENRLPWRCRKFFREASKAPQKLIER